MGKKVQADRTNSRPSVFGVFEERSSYSSSDPSSKISNIPSPCRSPSRSPSMPPSRSFSLPPVLSDEERERQDQLFRKKNIEKQEKARSDIVHLLLACFLVVWVFGVISFGCSLLGSHDAESLPPLISTFYSASTTFLSFVPLGGYLNPLVLLALFLFGVGPSFSFAAYISDAYASLPRGDEVRKQREQPKVAEERGRCEKSEKATEEEAEEKSVEVEKEKVAPLKWSRGGSDGKIKKKSSSSFNSPRKMFVEVEFKGNPSFFQSTVFGENTPSSIQSFYHQMGYEEIETTPWSNAGNVSLRAVSFRAMIPDLTDDPTSVEDEQRIEEKEDGSLVITSTRQLPDIDFGGQFMLYTVFQTKAKEGDENVTQLTVSMEIKFFQTTTKAIREGLKEVCLTWLHSEMEPFRQHLSRHLPL